MKVFELVRIGRELLKVASENGVLTGDWKYVEMYEEYRHMREVGIKYRYAIGELAREHHISRSTAERIVRKFQREC